ncbi:sigma 54-interacting transcriptional regulator [Fusobacterium sp.]|uniref:sigma-54 interaction domain-containing protein n=1 Tax=Fusobacterium sp. TaxID=68766 RepID=UPI0025C0D4AB|nr:sigma 54-interacting transcriptional regulator [Fusobacterium sp.]
MISWKILDKIGIGVAVYSKDGNIKYINEYGDKYFNKNYTNIFDIFSELDRKEILKGDFKILSKNYNGVFIMLFPQKDNNLIFFKEQEFFKSFSNRDKKNYDSKDEYSFENVIGNSKEIKKIIEECIKVSDNNMNLLITGESGTGKEFFARAIHNNSLRKDYPFIPLNCGAIPRDLIESELFGYEAGAFTGASKRGYTGKFELANGGTIFLDEIGEMPLSMQVSLLRVLQDKCVTKIGSKKCNRVDVRIIAATNKDLKKAVQEGRFRKDLYYRLTAFNIHLPPLKERIGDIPIFLDYLLKEKSIEMNKPIPKLSPMLFQKVISYCWPGNIRELENFVENFVALDGISTYDINFDECHCMTHDNLGNRINFDNKTKVIEKVEEERVMSIVELEKQEIKKALRVYNGNMTKIAAALGISRNALYNKIKRYEIESVEN